MSIDLVLASASPRRKEMLADAGYDFSVVSPDVDEIHDDAMDLYSLCEENAWLKADAVATVVAGALVIGADTLVCIDGMKLAKPETMDEARSMMRRLSGRTHEVCSAVALVRKGERPVNVRFHVISKVTFRELSEVMIDAYYEKVDPLDKAGGYAVQQEREMIIESIDGDYATIVGLPIDELVERLTALGIERTR